MVDLNIKPITNIVKWFRFINEHNGTNPMTDDYFLVNQIILPKTIPAKSGFKKAFGSLANDHVKGYSKFGDKKASWFVYDSNFSKLPRNANTISYIYADNPYEGFYRIRGMHNGETRISLNFYDYELYKAMCNRIFQ